VVAEQRDTLKNCARALGGGAHDVFLMPLKMRNGRVCYQLFLGNFPTRLSAEAELKRLPDLLQRQSPRLMQAAEIAAAQ
jgi:septal ring-binding cell division protein DamX